MYEAANMLNIGMIVFLTALGFSVFKIICFQRQGKLHPSGEGLPENANKLVFIPFTFNIVLLTLFVATSIIQSVLPESIIIVLLFIILFCAGISAAIGPSVEILGLYYAVCFTARYKGKGVKYIVISAIALILSLLILASWLAALIPPAFTYYGI